MIHSASPLAFTGPAREAGEIDRCGRLCAGNGHQAPLSADRNEILSNHLIEDPSEAPVRRLRDLIWRPEEPLDEMAPRAHRTGDVERRVESRNGHHAGQESLHHAILGSVIGDGDARIRNDDGVSRTERESGRRIVRPSDAADAELRSHRTELLEHETGQLRRMLHERVGRFRGVEEEAAGAKHVSRHAVPGVVQDGEQELRGRIGLRGIVRQRPQDAGRGLVVAAGQRADRVISGGLRAGERRDEKENRGERQIPAHGCRGYFFAGLSTGRSRFDQSSNSRRRARPCSRAGARQRA